MADEKRRIIYELLVEAKGAQQANEQVGAMGKGFQSMLAMAKPALAFLSAGFVLKGITSSLDELTKFNAQLETLGVTGETATQALHSVQDVAFVTGQSMKDVATAYGEAIELQQILGTSTASATRTTEAFVKIAAAEGKTATDAARQIQMLAFAIESGTLKSKEFINALKESNTFQQAAQEALGKTTEELVTMAKEGDITATQLVEILLAMEKIGEEKTAQATVTGLWESIKTLGTVMVQATAAGAGFNAKIGESQQTGFEKFLDGVRVAFEGIGGAIAVVNNFLQAMYDVGALIVTSFLNALNPSKVAELWDHYTGEVNRDLVEMWEGAKKFFAALDPRGPTQEEWDKYNEKVKKDLEDREKQARDTAWAKDFGKAFGDSFDKYVEIWKKGQIEAAEARKKIAEAEEKAQRERDKRQRYMWELREENEKNAAKRLEDFANKGMDDIADQLAAQNIKDLDAAIAEMGDVTIPGLKEDYLSNFQEMDQITQTLEQSLAGLFNGSIRNAREFFATLTQGIANIFAQLAAQQAASGIMDFLNLAIGMFGGVKPGQATQAGSGVSGQYRNYAATGGAFEHGHRMAFASGGVVSGPTTFGMAGGGAGLMGEAGPEAVMPLRRTSGGKLGVAGSMPNITVVNSTGVTAAARMERSTDRMTLILEAAQMGANMAEARVNRSLRSGYGSTAQSVQRTYGLRRRV
jgi:tape measure domain-containing protein